MSRHGFLFPIFLSLHSNETRTYYAVCHLVLLCKVSVEDRSLAILCSFSLGNSLEQMLMIIGDDTFTYAILIFYSRSDDLMKSLSLDRYEVEKRF